VIRSSVVMCLCGLESPNATPVYSLVHLPAHHARVCVEYELISGADEFGYSLCKLSDRALMSRISSLRTSELWTLLSTCELVPGSCAVCVGR
jgi:hypothetical protein